ncbi:dipeptidase [Algoriphagus namhaensis]
MNTPIFDMHCDLLSYLSNVAGANAFNKDDIGCAIPWLVDGGVRTQVTAIYTDVNEGSMKLAGTQADIFVDLLEQNSRELAPFDSVFLKNWEKEPKLALLASIENAAGLGNESAEWNAITDQLESILSRVDRLAYISLTHHTENRFGGGNYTKGIGLKKDGQKLLDYLSGRKIPIDLSHTSDLLAEGILTHLDKENLDVPVIASHSNFRAIWDHPRNLTDEFAKEVIHRKGILGVNFLRAFLDTENPGRLFDHILHGFEIGADEQVCFGADFFYTKNFGDPSRVPFYFPLAENASKYQSILTTLSQNLNPDQLDRLAYKNALNFYRNLWS